MEEQNKNNQTNENIVVKPINEILPRSTPSNSSQNDWLQLFDTLPADIPTAPNFEPRVPINFRQFYITDPCRLIRRIYIHMLGAIDTYTRLLTIAPFDDINTIKGLRSQMRVLSIAMLSIGNDLNYCSIIPFRTSSNSNIPSNYINALNITYNRVYNIFYETIMLYDILGTNTNQTRLLIIINNLRNQLATIDDLINRNS